MSAGDRAAPNEATYRAVLITLVEQNLFPLLLAIDSARL